MEESQRTEAGIKEDAEKPMFRLMHLLAPSDVRLHKRITSQDEIDYILCWIGFLDDQGNAINKNEAQLCLKQLGLLDNGGAISEDRALLVADYIWSQHPKKPDYASLVYWLKENHPRSDADISVASNGVGSRTTAEAKYLKKQAQKKKKIKRKQRRSSRKK